MAPSKNRINMHDIVAQPLGAVADAIDAVIRRPEALDEVELRSLFEETSYILLRVEEAYAMKDSEAACALIQLLLEGFTSKVDNALAIGWTTFTADDALLPSLKSIFTLVFLDEVVPLHSPGAENIAQLICTLSEGEALKENCGELFIPHLLGVLQRLYDRPAAANAHFQIQRSVAATLINLMKGSQQNKARVTDWTFLLPCLTMSTDFFFQLQCVELLYRVSRKNRALLKDLIRQLEGRHSRDEKLIEVLKSLDQLPSDENLLRRMVELVKSMDKERSDVVSLATLKIMAGETLLTPATQAFFTPHYMVILVATASADNVTIPYHTIRSVTIAKDGTVMFRLETFPVNIEPVMSRTGTGMDTVSVGLHATQLAVLKTSPVRGWIMSVLQNKAQERERANRSEEEERGERGGVPTASPRAPDGVAGDALGYPSVSPPETTSRKRPLENRTLTPPLFGSSESGSGRGASSRSTITIASTNTTTTNAKSNHASSPAGGAGGRTAAAAEATPLPPPSAALSLNDITLSDPSTAAPPDGSEARLRALDIKRLKTESGISSSSSDTRERAGAENHRGKAARPSPSSSASALSTSTARADSDLATLLHTLSERMPRKDRQAFLLQMERVAEAKRSIRVAEDVGRINQVIAAIQASLDAARDRCGKRREEWQAEVMRSVEQLDAEMKSSEETAARAVEKLNEGLRQVKASSQALEQRVACMRLRLQETIEKSLLAEQAAKETLWMECEAELERQECEMDEQEMATQQQAWRHAEAARHAAAHITATAPPPPGSPHDGGISHYSVGSLVSGSSVSRRASQE